MQRLSGILSRSGLVIALALAVIGNSVAQASVAESGPAAVADSLARLAIQADAIVLCDVESTTTIQTTVMIKGVLHHSSDTRPGIVVKPRVWVLGAGPSDTMVVALPHFPSILMPIDSALASGNRRALVYLFEPAKWIPAFLSRTLTQQHPIYYDVTSPLVGLRWIAAGAESAAVRSLRLSLMRASADSLYDRADLVVVVHRTPAGSHLCEQTPRQGFLSFDVDSVLVGSLSGPCVMITSHVPDDVHMVGRAVVFLTRIDSTHFEIVGAGTGVIRSTLDRTSGRHEDLPVVVERVQSIRALRGSPTSH